MAGSEEAPRCNAEPPNLTLGVELLRELLGIEQERLKVAVRIERERSLVFPETTIIIRDIQKLAAAIDAYEGQGQQKPIFYEHDLVSLLDDVSG